MEGIRIVIPLTPVTKKNSQQIKYRWGRDKTTGARKSIPYISPSEAYKRYADEAGWFITGGLRNMMISAPVNIKCIYYMPTTRKVDLTNLLEATDDVLVKYRVIADDDSDIVVSHDGSRVIKDKKAKPRAEITITFLDS